MRCPSRRSGPLVRPARDALHVSRFVIVFRGEALLERCVPSRDSTGSACVRFSSQPQAIERADHGAVAAAQHVRRDQRGLDAALTEQRLHGVDVVAVFGQVCRKGVAQGVGDLDGPTLTAISAAYQRASEYLDRTPSPASSCSPSTRPCRRQDTFVFAIRPRTRSTRSSSAPYPPKAEMPVTS